MFEALAIIFMTAPIAWIVYNIAYPMGKSSK